MLINTRISKKENVCITPSERESERGGKKKMQPLEHLLVGWGGGRKKKINRSICKVRRRGYKGIYLITLSHKPAGYVLFSP